MNQKLFYKSERFKEFEAFLNENLSTLLSCYLCPECWKVTESVCEDMNHASKAQNAICVSSKELLIATSHKYNKATKTFLKPPIFAIPSLHKETNPSLDAIPTLENS